MLTYVRSYARIPNYHKNNMKKGKKYREAFKKIEKDKNYSIDEALDLVLANKIAKFDESVEIHFNLRIDTKKGEQQVRGSIVLPHGTGKESRIGVVTSTKADEAKKAGADIIGADDLIGEIAKGKIEFDVLVATPEMMPKLAKAAKILGPKGLMPNPKSETITEKVGETVQMLKKGKVSFKNDKTGNLHQVVGRISFDKKALAENIKSFIEVVKKSKPADTKGAFIASASICSTMGPGVRIAV